jgi:hypothetical protein
MMYPYMPTPGMYMPPQPVERPQYYHAALTWPAEGEVPAVQAVTAPRRNQGASGNSR